MQVVITITSKISFTGYTLFQISSYNNTDSIYMFFNDTIQKYQTISNLNQSYILATRHATLTNPRCVIEDTFITIFFSNLFIQYLNTSTISLQSNYFQKPYFNSTFDLIIPPTSDMVTMNINWNKVNDCIIPSISRWSSLHPSLFSLELLFYILIFFVCLIFRNKQPLKSRGILPLIACFSQVLSLLSEIGIIGVSFEVSMNYYCYFLIFLFNIGNDMSLVLIPIHLFRYLYLVNFNNQKQVFTEKDEGTYEIIYFKIFKLLINPLFNVLVILIFIILLVVIQLIILGANNFQCGKSYTAVNITQNVFVLILCTIWFIMLFYDIVYKFTTRSWWCLIH